MSDLVVTNATIVIDPKQKVLDALNHAEAKVKSALNGTLDTIQGARNRVSAGVIGEGGYPWILSLAREIEKYIDRMP